MPPLPPPPETFALFAQEAFRLPYYVHLPVLLIMISLVYSATRHDDWYHIVREAIRWGRNLLVFLLIIVVVLYVLATVII